MMRRLISLLITLQLVIVLAPRWVLAETIQLPDIGDSSATLLTPEQERHIGRQVVQQLQRSGQVIEDPQLQQYLTGIGRAILSASGETANNFTFFIIDNDTINAFALPGGFIGIHSGLITASRNEGELASVIAHEIAHITQHHLARGYQKATQLNMPMTAAVIAAILLGASDPHAAQALLAGSMGASQQLQIDFTREYEREADRVGMQLLAGSGFDPHSMSSFFQRLYEETRLYANYAPEFLLTHPVTESRIADAQHRAGTLPKALPKDESTYRLLKSRIKVAQQHDMKRFLSDLQTLRRESPVIALADEYTYALALLGVGDYQGGKGQLLTLLKRDPSSILLRESLATAMIAEGEFAPATALLQEGLRLYPSNPILTLCLSESLFRAGKLDQAREKLLPIIRNHADFSAVHRQLAKIEAQRGHHVASQLAMADYYYLTYETRQALEQLRLAQKGVSLDFYDSSKIEARIIELEQELGQEKRDKPNN